VSGAGTVASAPAYYTAAQAERGRRVFGSVCSVCHGRNEFTGPIFSLTWIAEPVGHLFQHISTSMPQDDPGSLTLAEYAAVVAYMLELNGREPGDRELPTAVETLNVMRW
jgi:mono/diheme cytochrome c family protein